MKVPARFTAFRIPGRLKMPFMRSTSTGKQAFAKRVPISLLLAFVLLMVVAPFTAIQNSESIATFASDCSTPKVIFNLGDTVCAVANGALLGTPVQRRFEWVAPNGVVFQLGPDLTASPQNNSITIPTTGEFSQVGTWVVKTVDVSNDGYAVARFVVRDPGNAAVDLWTPVFGPFSVSAGSSAPFTVFVTNKGPNDAQNVELTVTVATNSTFLSESQTSGPAFTCTNPAVGATGSSTCTIATLPANTTAQIEFVYLVSSTAPEGAEITTTATVSSDTQEIFATDNTFTASATIPQRDAQNCDVTCPANIVTNKTAGQCGAAVSFVATGSGTNCGTIICDPPSGTFFPTGTTNVTCVGETGGPCTFTVTVRDPQPPSITCPSNITTDESSPGFGFATVNYPAPILNDNCAAGISDCNPPSGSTFEVGTTTVSCQTSNSSGQTATCSFTVTVVGANGGGCTITCPEDITQAASVGQCNAVVNYTTPTTSGTCGTVTCTPASGTTFQVGVTVVSCGNGSGASCDFNVTVLAASAPTITTCASNKTISADANCEAVIPNLLNEVVAAGCNVTLSQSPVAGSIVEPGIVTVTITAENITGEATCTATVTVLNSVPTTISCPPDITKSNDSNQCGAVVSYTAPTGSNACSTAAVSCSPASGSFFPKGATIVTCTATAGSSTATCTFSVTVNDTQPPSITCPANIAVGTDANSSIATVTYQATVQDNCPGASTTCTPASGSQFALGTTTVSCTATDAAGNSSSCSFTVTVTDTQPPTITCPASITKSNDANQCGAVATYSNPTVTDNTPGATATCSPASGSFLPVGTTTVTCTATDSAGNHSTCSFTITVKDTQAPVINCPANVSVSNAPGTCSATVNPGVATASDNCPGVTVVGVRSDGLALNAAYPVGTTTIVWTARDGAVPANQTSCTQTIVVNDTQAPTITLTGVMIELWPPNHSYTTINVSNLVSSATDNCGGNLTSSVVITKVTSDEGVLADADIIIAANCKSVQLRKDRNGGGDGRVYRIYFKVTDASGNATTATATVTVPHSQNGNPAVEGAAAYTVLSSCP
jgi:uncharacterized repeat protein (TIGR01451 family)